MIYRYNEKSLAYEKVPTIRFVKFASIAVLLILVVGASLGFICTRASDTKMVAYEDYVVMIEKIKDPFTPRKFYEALTLTNVKFPEIVWSQAVVESGFTSQVWRTNNNPFGMKLARVRATTAMGVKGEYAMYHHWKEAIYDYALYQNAYLMDIRTEEQYYNYLQRQYAEDPGYVEKVKAVRQGFEKCMEKFDHYYITSK